MSKFPKIPSTKRTPITDSKEKVQTLRDDLVTFSFKYHLSPAKFNHLTNDSDYFCKFLERIKDVSKMTMREFRNDRSKALRSHLIKWEETTEDSFGLPGEDQLVDCPWEFSLSANEYGRVHGFIIETRFYVVWLDKDHHLYN